MIDQQRLYQLLQRAKQQTISGAEYAEIEAFLNAEGEDGEEARAVLDDYYFPTAKEIVIDLEAPKWRSMLRGILNVEKPIAPIPAVPVAHRMNFVRKWWWAAAVVILLTATGVYLYTSNSLIEPVLVEKPGDQAPAILAGRDKAILTLADGRTIALDSASNGQLAQQGNASVIKLANGEVRYNLEGASEGVVMMNIMRTPRGGQYQLTLPDGTKVWLNAASSITYPAVFTGNDRKVKVTGEVYLEVAPNKTKPFIADIDGKSIVQVLGTGFNINSYADDGEIKITLINGSVKVIAKEKEVLLSPGQQVIQLLNNSKTIEINSNADLNQTLAWKNGIFNFNGKNFSSLMKDVERWYDVTVVYKGATPNFNMKGKMDRGVPLNDLLRFLKEYGLIVQVEGRTLIISEK